MGVRVVWVGLIVCVMVVGLPGCAAYYAEKADAHGAKMSQQALASQEATKKHQVAAIDAQVAQCRQMKKSPRSPYYVGMDCDALEKNKAVLAQAQLATKRRRCEDLAFHAEGGLFRPVDYIPIVGTFTYLDRKMNVLTDEKGRTLGAKGKKVYEECMTQP